MCPTTTTIDLPILGQMANNILVTAEKNRVKTWLAMKLGLQVWPGPQKKGLKPHKVMLENSV